MSIVANFNDGWRFYDGAVSPGERAPHGRLVDLPHNAVELPFNYFDETSYQKAFSYQKELPWRDEFADSEVSLLFDAVMADAVVYLNGQEVVAHKDGYTPFEGAAERSFAETGQPHHR